MTAHENRMYSTKSNLLGLVLLLAALVLAVAGCGGDNSAGHGPAAEEQGAAALNIGEGPAVAPPEVLAALTARSEDTKLTAGDAAAGDVFGRAVAISGDTAVVGALGDDDGGSNSGSAYVFVRSGSAWSQQAKITASDASAFSGFGQSVALSGDTAVVGAPGDNNGGTSSGSAYVFQRSGTAWSQQAKLTVSDSVDRALFGNSVAITGDTALVGAVNDFDAGRLSGSAYVFQRSGATWSQQTKLIASDAAAGDNFGSSVALSGNTALVGAQADDGVSTNSGSAYVFVRSGTAWSEQAKLTANDAAFQDIFGNSVALSGDTVVVGALGDNDGGADSGSAYIFQRSGSAWSQQAKLTASDAAAADFFGISVGISGDRVVVSARNDDDGGADSGSAYVFVRSGTAWSEQAKLTASDAAAGDFFGISVAIDGNTALVGANGDDDAGTNSGSAYVFDGVGAPAVTPFAVFNIEEAEAELEEDGHEIEVEGRFVAASAFDVLTEEVTVTFGGFSASILAGSFVRDEEEQCFKYEGGEPGITKVEICDNGKFEVKGKGLDLSGIDFDNPVLFSLQIGNDLGETEIPFSADGEDEFKFGDDDDDHDDDGDKDDHKKKKHDKKRRRGH